MKGDLNLVAPEATAASETVQRECSPGLAGVPATRSLISFVHASHFLSMLVEQVPGSSILPILDTSLTLHAAQTRNASIANGLVTGSPPADPHIAGSWAISTLRGPLRGGVTQATVTIGKGLHTDVGFYY